MYIIVGIYELNLSTGASKNVQLITSVSKCETFLVVRNGLIWQIRKILVFSILLKNDYCFPYIGLIYRA